MGRDHNLPFYQLLEPIQQFLSDSDSGCLHLKSQHFALAIAKKILHENHVKCAQKTTHHMPPNFKVDDRVFFKNKQPGKWDLKQRDGYRIGHIGHNGHYLHIENQATAETRTCNVKDVVHKLPVKICYVDTIFGRVGKCINHPANLPTITLNAT